MPFDFKKEYKEQYRPSASPQLIKMPAASYLAVRGQGDPNQEGGDYQQAISILYGVAYTLKMSYRSDHQIPGFYEYVVPPLEGLWWQEETAGVDYGHKETFHWISLLRLPDFITEEDVKWAKETAAQKKKIDCSACEFFPLDEGLCVQIMHKGSFDDEPASVARMDAYIQEQGYENDLNENRLHHEIYLSDPRKTDPEKWQTVIRHPIKKSS